MKYPISSMLIHKARMESGLTQAEFIEKNGLKVTQATFSRWERGLIQAPANVLFELGVVSCAIESDGAA
ncbi:helix-turn-helix transcriptional regulator [Vibrio fluvialis]|nr:helix-turn-helix transcriptional regulator [Vibrio fluvialis]EKO3527253.1 helix-turn-helix transcriptional regulator [Vibrio fluvialis]